MLQTQKQLVSERLFGHSKKPSRDLTLWDKLSMQQSKEYEIEQRKLAARRR